MGALTADRDTPRRENVEYYFPMKGSVKAFAGGLAVLDGGYVKPMVAAAGLVVVGRFEEQVDNSSGSDGDLSVKVRRGVFRFNNSSSTDQITLADVGSSCYGVDDQTVAKTNGSSSRSVAGTIRDVDSDGVWVEI